MKLRGAAAYLQLLRALLVVAAGAYVALGRYELVPRKHRLEVAGEVLIVVVAALSSLKEAVDQFRGPRIAKSREDMRVLASGLAWTVHDITGCEVRDMGVGIWVVKRRWPRFWEHHLERQIRERVSNEVAPSDVVWTKGKGVIGRVWECGRGEVADVAPIDRKHLQSGPEQWARARSATRMGMSYTDYTQTRGKYGTIIAMPIRSDGTLGSVIGVVAVDAPGGYKDHFDNPKVREAVATAARALQTYLR